MNICEFISVYQNSYNYERLNGNTKTQYAYYLNIIAGKFGHNDFSKLETRDFILKIRDFLRGVAKEHPRKAAYMTDIVIILLNWGLDDAYLTHNMIRYLKVYKPPASKKMTHWNDIHINHVMRYASDPLKNFVIVALETGLRPCSVRELKHDQIKTDNLGNMFLAVPKAKRKYFETDDKLYIPLSEKLKFWLKHQVYKNEYLVNGQDNKPFDKNKIDCLWKRYRKKHYNFFKGLTLGGLRKTTVTRLASSGCTILEISAVLGWSIKTVQRMLDEHYFTDKLTVATKAIDKINQSSFMAYDLRY